MASGGEAPGKDDQGVDGEGEIREQDRFLPIANITRIMKRSLGGNAKIAKDAKETIQECVSEFISFVTSEASDRCAQEKRKTINGDDIIFAMQSLGFDSYVEPLKLYLTKYREWLDFPLTDPPVQSVTPKPEKVVTKDDKELSQQAVDLQQHPPLASVYSGFQTLPTASSYALPPQQPM